MAVTASTGSSSVFDDGLPLAATDWIRNGELAALMQSRYSAELTGLPFTPAVDNLLLGEAGATGSVDDLVSGVERGLLLTCLWYIREVDPQTLLLTGLTRDWVSSRERRGRCRLNNFPSTRARSPARPVGTVGATSRRCHGSGTTGSP